MMSKVGISLCLCFVIGIVYADEHTKSESDLRRALFENYDKLVRPVRSINDVIHVETEIAPYAIKDVDVKDKTVKLDTWLYARWEDAYLSWDPAEYGGFSQLSIPASEVWKPDLSVYFATPDTHLQPSVQTNVVIFPNGTVLWVPPFTVKSRCPDSTGVSPNSFQCTIKLGTWTYDVSQVVVREHEQDILQGMAKETYLDTNEKWRIVAMTASSEDKIYSCCPQAYSLVKFNVVFEKKQEQEQD